MARPLRLVNPETGEITEHSESALERRYADQVEINETLANKNRNLKGRITELLQQAEENHKAFPNFRRCHDYWKKRCHHLKTEYEIEDFKLWLPLYEKHDLDTCLRAIDGAAFDCYISTRKNGSKHRHDEWELIHRKGGGKFREFVNKAPYHKPKPEHLAIVSKAILWLHPSWPYEQVTAEAKVRVRRWAT